MGTPFPKIPIVDSVKKWQMSFFYVRSENPVFDRLNVPEYNPGCVTEGRLCAEDLLCTYADRRVLPLQARAFSRGKKRASERSTAALEAKVKKQRRQGPKKVPETAGAAIKFSKGGGSRPASRVVLPAPRPRREPTPQPTSRARTPPLIVSPVVTPPSAGASSSAAPSPTAPSSGAQGEPARRSGQPTLDDLFPRRTRLLEPAGGAGRGAPGGAGAGGAVPPVSGVGGAAPNVVVLDESPEGAPQAPGSAVPTEPTASTVPPPSSEPTREEPAREEPAREEPARSSEADARALVRTEGPTGPPQGLHVAKGARLLNVVSASDSSLGSAGTMEKAWHQADACEVSNRDGRPGVAPMNMSFSGFRAHLKTKAAETDAHLARLEEADKAEEEKVESLRKRLEEVDRQRLQLRDEVTTKSNELSATTKRLVEEISALDCGLAAAFPEEQAAALAAVSEARDARRRETGEGSSDCFSMEDYLASMATRVAPITMLGWELRKAAEELIRLLWPTETLPKDLANLITWLDKAPDRFLDWKESAALR
nr:uncharacterized protein LOC127325922 [Lolium perenne]